MKLTEEQQKELVKKLGQYFLDYSIRYGKNVVHRYVSGTGNVATIGQANETPNVWEFVGILTKED